MKTTIADYDSKIREMAETHTIKEIADEIGYSVSYLATYQDENNIKAQRAPTIPERLKQQDARIRELAQTMTRQEIADELEFNARYISAYTLENSIETIRSKKITIRDYDHIIRKLAPTLTVEEIAENIGYSAASVRNHCKDNDIKPFKNPTIKDYEEEIIGLAKTKTVQEIGEEIGYSTTSVAQFLINKGVRPFREPHGNKKGRHTFETKEIEFERDVLFIDYFNNWVTRFKKGIVHPNTLANYLNAYNHISLLAPDLKLREMTRDRYQRLLNDYAVDHAEASVKSFHRALRKSLVDAFYEGVLKKDPTYNIITKGYEMKEEKKFYSEKEINQLREVLELDTKEIGYDHLIYLLVKTGLRFAEALGLTVGDCDFENKTISVNKTLVYKNTPGQAVGDFAPTKNESSNRVIQLDDKTNNLLKKWTTELEATDLIFSDLSWHSSTANAHFKRRCVEAGIKDEISLHGLRHTHASVLISNGVNILAVSERLGHSKPETTQNIYIHRTKELERKDKTKIRTVLTLFKAGEVKWPEEEGGKTPLKER